MFYSIGLFVLISRESRMEYLTGKKLFVVETED